MSELGVGPVVAKRPSWVGYVIGVLLMVFGVVGAAVWLTLGIRKLDDTIDGFIRVEAPASGELTIDRTGGLTVYVENGNATLELSGPDGEPVTLEPYIGELTYEEDGREGRAILTFEAEAEGPYRIQVTGTGTVAIGESVARPLVSSVVGMVVIGAVGLLAGILVIVVTAVRRSRAGRSAPPTAAPVGWSAPPGAAVGWAQPVDPAAGWGTPPPPPGWGTPPPPAPGWGTPPPPPGWGTPSPPPPGWGSPPPPAPHAPPASPGWAAPPPGDWDSPPPQPPAPPTGGR